MDPVRGRLQGGVGAIEQTPIKLYHSRRRRNNLCVRRIGGAGFDTTPKNNLLTRAPSYVLDMFLQPQRRTSLSAPLEPAPTLRGGGPLAAAYRSKADAKMLINGPGPRRRVTENLRRVQPFRTGKFGRKPLKDLGLAAKFSERIGRELIVFGTIWKA